METKSKATSKAEPAVEQDATTEQAESPVVAQGQKHISPSNLQDASHFRTRYCAVVGASATLDDIQRPDFWVHVASKLRRMDVIEVIPESEGWFAELLVLSTGTGFAKVKLIREVQIEEQIAPNIGLSTDVMWGGPAAKWRVIRLADGAVLSENHESKGSAIRWQVNHERALAA
jgi:hypothetical protein